MVQINESNMDRLAPALREYVWTVDDPNRPTKPKGKTGPQLKTIIKRILDLSLDLDDPITKKRYQMTVAENLALQLLKRGLEGNLTALNMILDRVDGKVGEKVEVTTAIASAPAYDLSKLSEDELLAFRKTVAKAQLKQPESSENEEEPVVIDV